jgi:hypothetical protein
MTAIIDQPVFAEFSLKQLIFYTILCGIVGFLVLSHVRIV